MSKHARSEARRPSEVAGVGTAPTRETVGGVIDTALLDALWHMLEQGHTPEEILDRLDEILHTIAMEIRERAKPGALIGRKVKARGKDKKKRRRKEDE